MGFGYSIGQKVILCEEVPTAPGDENRKNTSQNLRGVCDIAGQHSDKPHRRVTLVPSRSVQMRRSRGGRRATAVLIFVAMVLSSAGSTPVAAANTAAEVAKHGRVCERC
jgi:hypothetical protein